MPLEQRDTTGVGGGEATTASNVGTGEGLLVKGKTGSDIKVRKLKNGGGIGIAVDGDDVALTNEIEIPDGDEDDVVGLDGEGALKNLGPFPSVEGGGLLFYGSVITLNPVDGLLDIAAHDTDESVVATVNITDADAVVASVNGIDTLPGRRVILQFVAGGTIYLDGDVTQDEHIYVPGGAPIAVEAGGSVMIFRSTPLLGGVEAWGVLRTKTDTGSPDKFADVGLNPETIDTADDDGNPIRVVHVNGDADGPNNIYGFTAPAEGDAGFVLLVVDGTLTGGGAYIHPESGTADDSTFRITYPAGKSTDDSLWFVQCGARILFAYDETIGGGGEDSPGRWTAVASNELATATLRPTTGGLVINFANADLDLTNDTVVMNAVMRAKFLVFITTVTQTADRTILLPQPDAGGEDSAGEFGVKEWKVRNRSTANFKLILQGVASQETGDFVAMGPSDVDNIGKSFAEIAVTPNGVHIFGYANNALQNAKQIATSGTIS